MVSEMNGAQDDKADAVTSEKESRVLSAYKNAAKIKSTSAQSAFLNKFIPQMESQLGLVNFVSDDVREIIKENPNQATNIVELMRNAQRRMKAEASDNKAFKPSSEPMHVGRVKSLADVQLPEDVPTRDVSKSNYRIQAAIKLIKARVKDMSKLTGQSLDVLRAVLSDEFSDEEIEQVFMSLGLG